MNLKKNLIELLFTTAFCLDGQVCIRFVAVDPILSMKIQAFSQFTILMWGRTHTKKCRNKNRIDRGYLVVLKGRKIG